MLPTPALYLSLPFDKQQDAIIYTRLFTYYQASKARPIPRARFLPLLAEHGLTTKDILVIP